MKDAAISDAPRDRWGWLPDRLAPRPQSVEDPAGRRVWRAETIVLVVVFAFLATATINDLVRQGNINHRLIADLRTWRDLHPPRLQERRTEPAAARARHQARRRLRQHPAGAAERAHPDLPRGHRPDGRRDANGRRGVVPAAEHDLQHTLRALRLLRLDHDGNVPAMSVASETLQAAAPAPRPRGCRRGGRWRR